MSSCKYYNCQINIITHSPAYEHLNLKIPTTFSIFHLERLLAYIAAELTHYEMKTSFSGGV